MKDEFVLNYYNYPQQTKNHLQPFLFFLRNLSRDD